MEMLSREYGWLPSQIKNENSQDIQTYIDIISIRNLLERAKQKKYGRK